MIVLDVIMGLLLVTISLPAFWYLGLVLREGGYFKMPESG